MEKFATLLALQKQIRDASNLDELAFIASNKTHDLIPYKQCVFWSKNELLISLKSVSGMAKLDTHGPYAVWLKSLIQNQLSKQEDTIIHIPKEGGGEWIADYNYLVRMCGKDNSVLGGLWIEMDRPLTQPQLDLLREITDCYAQSLELIHHRNKKNIFSSFLSNGRFKKWILVGLICLFLFPVRLSITAPAEIVASDAVAITMPYDGVLESIEVNPSDTVETDNILAFIDKTAIQTDFDKASQALKAAQASLSRAGMESLRSDEKKQDLMELRADIAKKNIELDFAKKKLEDTNIKAPVDGVVIFSDKSALESKPLSTGEKIMTIADPNKKELLIRIPAQSLLPINNDLAISFYVNTKPLKGYEAIISSIGYEASADPDGLLTYKVRAALSDNNTSDLRIGWKGTAKIKSHWSVFGYALLRRPLIALRNLTGL